MVEKRIISLSFKSIFELCIFVFSILFNLFIFFFLRSVVSKVNEHMPTPLVLGCFCEDCQTTNNTDHQYHLYGVIMHLGATMASGHYVAYVKARDSSIDYDSCTRERRKTASLTASLSSSGAAAAAAAAAGNANDKTNSKKKWFFRSSKNGSLTDTRGQYFR